jgi:hypothetical protein
LAIFYNPRIVTDGLVLALDAANIKSYPGSGTTWTDISGSGNNGTGVLPIYNTSDNYGLVKDTGTRTDSLSSSLQLCIPCGAQSGLDLNDLSVTGRSSSLQTVTNNGVVNTLSTSKFYGGTGDFSGSATQWASVPNDGRFNLASRQYTTIEFWYRCDSTGGNKGVLATGSYGSNGWEIYVEANGGCNLVVWDGSTGIVDVRTGAATFGVWHHCAFIIDYTAGTKTVTPYLDGVTSGSTSTTTAFPNGSANLYIGRRNTWATADSGTLYLQDIRIYSAAKYTSNFTPFFTTLKTGTLANAQTYSRANGGSIVFNGTSQYVQLSPQNIKSVDFSVELWFYATKAVSSDQILYTTYNLPSGAQSQTLILNISSSGKLNCSNGNGQGAFGSTTTFSTNTWYHVVATYTASSSTQTTYINGNFEASGVGAITSEASSNFIGGSPGDNNIGSLWFGGRISAVKVYRTRALSAAEVKQNYNALSGRLTYPPTFTPGLSGKFFNGTWTSTIATGNIGTLPLTTTNDSSNVTGTTGLPSAAHRFGVNLWPSIAYGDSIGDNYGFIAIGYFTPPTTGTYTIFTSSDDGSGVWIGDLALPGQTRTSGNATLNNSMGAGQANTERSATIALTAGVRYPIRIVHEEATGGDNLTFSWSGPGISKTTDLLTYFTTITENGQPIGDYL